VIRGHSVLGMLKHVRSIVTAIARRFRSRAVLELENLALHHQLHVLRRQRPGRHRLFAIDRLLWVWLYRLWPHCLETMVLVKPATVVQWHRQGFRLFWRWRSRSGRPSVDREVRDLIRQMSAANPLWGVPRIHGELLKLGIQISQATVAKYMVRRRGTPSPTWRSFLRNQAAGIAAIDIFVVASASFGDFPPIDTTQRSWLFWLGQAGVLIVICCWLMSWRLTAKAEAIKIGQVLETIVNARAITTDTVRILNSTRKVDNDVSSFSRTHVVVREPNYRHFVSDIWAKLSDHFIVSDIPIGNWGRMDGIELFGPQAPPRSSTILRSSLLNERTFGEYDGSLTVERLIEVDAANILHFSCNSWSSYISTPRVSCRGEFLAQSEWPNSYENSLSPSHPTIIDRDTQFVVTRTWRWYGNIKEYVRTFLVFGDRNLRSHNRRLRLGSSDQIRGFLTSFNQDTESEQRENRSGDYISFLPTQLRLAIIVLCGFAVVALGAYLICQGFNAGGNFSKWQGDLRLYGGMLIIIFGGVPFVLAFVACLGY
jgi:hypothetical protein